MATTEISGRTFDCKTIPALKAALLAVRIAKMLAPIGGDRDTITELTNSAKSSDGTIDREKLKRVAIPLIAGFIENLDEDKFMSIINELLSYARIQDESGAFMDVIPNIHFEGDLMGLFSCAYFVAEANVLSDFFSDL